MAEYHNVTASKLTGGRKKVKNFLNKPLKTALFFVKLQFFNGLYFPVKFRGSHLNAYVH